MSDKDKDKEDKGKDDKGNYGRGTPRKERSTINRFNPGTGPDSSWVSGTKKMRKRVYVVSTMGTSSYVRSEYYGDELIDSRGEYYGDELIDFTTDKAICRIFLTALIEAFMARTVDGGGSSAKGGKK